MQDTDHFADLLIKVKSRGTEKPRRSTFRRHKTRVRCDTSKVPYGSHKHACEALNIARRSRRPVGTKPVRVYLCECGYWHITGQRTFD